MEVITVKNLYKTFKSKKNKIDALKEMTFSVERGEILGFLGPNGAGKSTTIKIMMNLIKQDRGEVKIFNIDSRNPMSRLKIGFMPENPQYYDTLTGYDLLIYSALIFNMDKKVAKSKAKALLEEFELAEYGKQLIRKYSKGMIQRIGFASTLIHDPEILVLDEPMSGLDPVGRILFKRKMLELNKKGVTIFFSSHIIPDVEDICSRVIIVRGGKVIKSLEKKEIKYLTTVGFEIIINKKVDIENIELNQIDNNLFKVYVSKKDIDKVLEKLKNKEIEIIDIEPVKKNLENIFIEITSKNKT